jgi:hypothetical protein
MLSFLPLSSFVTPSLTPESALPEGALEGAKPFWQALVSLGFSDQVAQESFGVLDPARWQAASRKLGENVRLLDVSGQDENGVAYWQPGAGSFFVEVMQQFTDALLAELDALEMTDQALPALRREADYFSRQGEVEKALHKDRQIEGAEQVMLQYHALIPARLAAFRRWAETYDLMPDARAFFFEYTKLRSGQGMALDALFQRFTVT